MTAAKPSARPSPFRDRRRSIAAVAVLSIITGLLETATIVSIVAFIEGVTSGDLLWEIDVGPIELALDRLSLGVVAGISLVGMSIGQVASSWLRSRAVFSWQFEVQMTAIGDYLRTDWATQSSESSGSLQNLMGLCASASQGLSALMGMFTAGGALLVFGSVAVFASPVASAVLFAAGVVSMLALKPIRSRSREATRSATIAQRAVSEYVGQVHDLAQEIQVHGVGEVAKADLRRSARQVRRARIRASVHSDLGGVIYRSLGLSLVLVGAIVASGLEDLDVARVGVAGLLLLRSLSYGQRIQASWQTLENNRPYIEQVGEALELYRANAPERGSTQVEQLGTIEFRDVSYSYDDEALALDGINLRLSPGETLGVVGPSGSGKSTLAQILLGLREPSAGAYTVDGLDAMSIAAEDWFRRICVVPQQPKLLPGSILDNILFYRTWIGRGEAIAAAKAAGLHDEIEALADGYDTIVGDAIRDLSGGQRQRLGIARALVGSPELLVLDEPTSALDAISEAVVQETLAQLKGSVTVVIIAHRLATLNHCDRLLVLEDGAVNALDTPAAVFDQSDFYRKSVEMQLVRASETT